MTSTSKPVDHVEGSDDCWYYKVKMTHELVEQIAIRTIDGYRIHIVWGESDNEGFYQPAITIDYDDKLGA